MIIEVWRCRLSKPSPARGRTVTAARLRDHPGSSSAIDVMVEAVIAFAGGRPAKHVVIAGGFGAGKSYALGRAASIARSAGLQVATIERGPLGISSYWDLLVAVKKATRLHDSTALGRVGVQWGIGGDAHGIELADLERDVLYNEREPGLVIVTESIDQLLHQVRSVDRPRIMELLTRPVGTALVLGSAHGTGLAAELKDGVELVRATCLPDIEAGMRLARQEAQLLGKDTPQLSAHDLRDVTTVDGAIKSNWLYWSLVGRYMVIARSDPLRWAEDEFRMRAASHFDAMLLTLAPSEQRVLVALAAAASPRSVGQIADAIGVRNQAVATALGRLRADDWVAIVDMPSERDRRRTWYDLSDPLLRLHLMSPHSRRW